MNSSPFKQICLISIFFLLGYHSIFAQSEGTNYLASAKIDKHLNLKNAKTTSGSPLIIRPNAGQPKIVALKSLLKLCPNKNDGHLKAGTQHFDSKVDARVRIRPYLSEDRRQLKVNVFLLEKSVKRPTRLEANFERVLYTAPFGKKIDTYYWNGQPRTFHNSDKLDNFHKILKEGGPELWGCNDGDQYEMVTNKQTVKSIKIIGDTGGQDISTDRDCKCDSKIQRIDFNRIQVILSDFSVPNDLTNCNMLKNKHRGYTVVGNSITREVKVKDNGGSCEYDINAKWIIEKGNKSGIYYLKNKKNGKYLSVVGSGKDTQLVSSKNSKSSWKFNASNEYPGYYYIINESTKGALHTEYNKLQVERNTPTGWWSSKWKLDWCSCNVIL